MIVDDFAAIVDRISRLLGSLSTIDVIEHVRTTNNIEESVTAFQPHIIISDLHVGEGATIMAGLNAISRIKAVDSSAQVIVFTNFTDPGYRSLSFANGANYFLDKAFDSDQLVAIVLRIYDKINSQNPQ